MKDTMKLRSWLLAVTLMVVSGTVGFELGEQKLRISFRNWKPAVVYNQTAPVDTSGAKADFSHFWVVWDKLSAEYVDKSALVPEKMVDGAISGMVAAAGDPYTVYLPPQQNKEAKEDLGGSFEGVGIQLGFKDGKLAVVSPLEGMPAVRAGVRAGDYIVHIKDDKKKVDRDTDGMSLPEAVRLIRGEKGTRVELTLFREGGKDTFKVNLERDTIVVKSVELQMLETGEEKVGWIKLNRFGDRTQEEWAGVVGQLASMQAEQLRGVALDLRNNPGGYLEGAVWIAGEFLPAGKIVVSQQYGDGTKIDEKVKRNGQLLKQSVVVIVNKGSASAAEILAGALQDHGRVEVTGEQSFGKGSVQQPDDFPNGSGLHVTIARWLRPNGEWIDKKGITPDFEVKWEPDENASDSGDWKSDLQLVKAVEIL